MAADAEATLPALVEAVRRLITADRRRYFERSPREAGRRRTTRRWTTRARRPRRDGTRARSAPRGCAPRSGRRSKTPTGRWWPTSSSCRTGRCGCGTMDKHYHYIGGPGGYGVGYGAPAAVGAALANRKHGRLTVNFQYDGDLMFAPGALWTAAHHKIPLLTVMHNNRAYHQEVMEVQRMALAHGRNATRAHIGTKLEIRRSISRSWRRAWASTARARSRTRRISAPRSGARSTSSNGASRRSSTC